MNYISLIYINLILNFVVIAIILFICLYASKILKFLIIDYEKIAKRVYKVENYIDLLGFNASNQAVQSIYKELKNTPDDKFPKSYKEILQSISNKNYILNYTSIQKKIEESDNIDERNFLEKKLEKLKEIKNLMDITSNDSSEAYSQSLLKELNKSIEEFMSDQE
jgi:hypothetical protein